MSDSPAREEKRTGAALRVISTSEPAEAMLVRLLSLSKSEERTPRSQTAVAIGWLGALLLSLAIWALLFHLLFG